MRNRHTNSVAGPGFVSRITTGDPVTATPPTEYDPADGWFDGTTPVGASWTETAHGHPTEGNQMTTPTTPMTEFERGARAAIEAHDLYFRHEDETVAIAEARASADAPDGFEWVPLTDSELDAYAAGAIADVLRDEATRLPHG